MPHDLTPPTELELQTGAAAVADAQLARRFVVALVDGGGTGSPEKDQQAAEALEQVLNDMHAAQIDPTFLLPNGINRWTIVGKRR